MIIAEAGVNHNGDLKLAKKLADEAKSVGADAVKFQTFWGITRLEKYELTVPEWIRLKGHCDDIGIQFISTPHTMDAIHFVDTLVNIHKIASPFLYSYNFLIEMAKKNKPILLSTGNHMSDSGVAKLDEISNATKWIKKYSKNEITLLCCVSKYPLNYPNYERVNELKYLGYPIGLSDHTKNIYPPKGLPVYEKHFMLEDGKCIDKNVSLKPSEFKEMVKWLKSA